VSVLTYPQGARPRELCKSCKDPIQFLEVYNELSAKSRRKFAIYYPLFSGNGKAGGILNDWQNLSQSGWFWSRLRVKYNEQKQGAFLLLVGCEEKSVNFIVTVSSLITLISVNYRSYTVQKIIATNSTNYTNFLILFVKFVQFVAIFLSSMVNCVSPKLLKKRNCSDTRFLLNLLTLKSLGSGFLFIPRLNRAKTGYSARVDQVVTKKI
jgi:hypothetical protein